MKIVKLALLLLIIATSTAVYGQVPTLHIGSIDIQGAEKNDLDYLYNFVDLKEGDMLKADGLESVRQQLIRRTGISNVTYKIDTLLTGRANISLIIEEQKTFRPQLGIGGLTGNFWWQVGAAEYNLTGKEKTLIATYMQNDKQPNFQLYFENSRINGQRWGYALDINRQSSIEPLYFPSSTVIYKYANLGAGASLMYSPSFYTRLIIGTSLFREEYSKNTPQDIGTSEGPDDLTENKFLLKAQYEFNKVSYDYFYRRGTQWRLLAQTVNSIDFDERFVDVSTEINQYWRPWSNGNIASRFRFALATNRPSPFAPFVLDSKVNLRGSGNRVDRGTAQLVINLEYRHTVFHNDKFAGQVVSFLDFGTWRNPGGELNQLFDKDQFREFIGMGIRFINNSVIQSTLRLDYGIDLTDRNQRGFVFGVGQYF